MRSMKQNGFTLVELIIVMVLLGILAAVAIPKMGNTISSSEEAAENAIIAALATAVEMFAMDRVVENSVKSYPDNPFDEMDKPPSKYTGTGIPTEDGEWTFFDETEEKSVRHQRNDNTLYKWVYTKDTGVFGGRIAL